MEVEGGRTYDFRLDYKEANGPAKFVIEQETATIPRRVMDASDFEASQRVGGPYNVYQITAATDTTQESGSGSGTGTGTGGSESGSGTGTGGSESGSGSGTGGSESGSGTGTGGSESGSGTPPSPGPTVPSDPVMNDFEDSNEDNGQFSWEEVLVEPIADSGYKVRMAHIIGDAQGNPSEASSKGPILLLHNLFYNVA